MKQIIFCVDNFAGIEHDRHEIAINEVDKNTKHLAIREQKKTTTLKALLYARWLLMDSFMGEPDDKLFVPTYLNRGGITSFFFLLIQEGSDEKYKWQIKLFNGVIISELFAKLEGNESHTIFNRYHPQYDELDKNFFGYSGPEFSNFDANAKHVFESPLKELMGITHTVRKNASLYSTWRQFGHEDELDIHLTYANLSRFIGDQRSPLDDLQDTLKALYEDKELQDSLHKLLRNTYCLSGDSIMDKITGIHIKRQKDFRPDGIEIDTYIGYVSVDDRRDESSILFRWLPRKALLMAHYFVQISKNIRDNNLNMIVLDDIDHAGVEANKFGQSPFLDDSFTKFINGINNSVLVCSTSDILISMPEFEFGDDDDDY